MAHPQQDIPRPAANASACRYARRVVARTALVVKPAEWSTSSGPLGIQKDLANLWSAGAEMASPPTVVEITAG